MGIRYLELLAAALPVWGFMSSLEPWQALVAIVVIPPLYMVYYVALGPVIGWHEGLKENAYKAKTGRNWPRSCPSPSMTLSGSPAASTRRRLPCSDDSAWKLAWAFPFGGFLGLALVWVLLKVISPPD